MTPTVPPEIQPEELQDAERWGEQALRLRVLSGEHAADVQDVLLGMFSGEIADGLALDPDLHVNTFKLITQDLTTLYMSPPEVTASPEGLDLSPISTGRLWSQQGQTEFIVRGLNECLVRMDWPFSSPSATQMTYRVVEPSFVVVTKTAPDDPTVPLALEELRWRKHPQTGEIVWTWDAWDVSDPESPTYRIESVETEDDVRKDLTGLFLPAIESIGYPYLDPDGGPVFPYVMYHKRDSGRIWSPFEGTELVNGTLRLAAFWSQWGDGYRNASHPQRWAMDVDTLGGVQRVVDGVPVEMVPIDRKSILKFRAKGPAAQLGQFDPTMDPIAGAEALRIYEAGLAIHAGLSPADLKVTEQSGRAIEITRDGKRRHQKMLAPQMERGDKLLLASAARIANRFLGSSELPMTPESYSVQYRSLLPTAEERKAALEDVKARLSMGLISKVDALMKTDPSVKSEEEAIEKLARIQRLEAMIATTAVTGA